MSVTLEVSKLSGWLNDDALCRGSKRGHAVWDEVCGSAGGEAAGDRGASSVQKRARAACGEGIDCTDMGKGLTADMGEERTANMRCMFVTVDMSKLSAWLNAYAACGVGRGMRVGRREAADDRGASSVQGRARLQTRGQGMGRSALGTCSS